MRFYRQRDVLKERWEWRKTESELKEEERKGRREILASSVVKRRVITIYETGLRATRASEQI